MSADFETCPVGTLARLRRVEEAARKVVRHYTSVGINSDDAFLKALLELEAIYSHELEAERQADEAERMRDVTEVR